MIRPAELTDLDDMLPLCERFHAEAAHTFGGFVEADMREALRHWVLHGLAFVAEEGGELVGLVTGGLDSLFYNSDVIFAQEALWYVLPGKRNGAGRALFNAFEQEAKARGATVIVALYMTTARDRAFGRFLEKRGYAHTDQLYTRVL